MKYVVMVDGNRFQVELGDLHTQPIVALVDGEPVEVWLESENGVQPYFARRQPEKPAISTPKTATAPAAPILAAATVSTTDTSSVLAPIPGVILSIAVRPGQEVKPGQELCVLEAMKMKNTIRAARHGVVASIAVIPGQTVQHHDLLIEFEPIQTA